MEAYESDLKANNNKRPAMAKLILLKEAMNLISKKNLHEYLLDNGMLSTLRVRNMKDAKF